MPHWTRQTAKLGKICSLKEITVVQKRILNRQELARVTADLKAQGKETVLAKKQGPEQELSLKDKKPLKASSVKAQGQSKEGKMGKQKLAKPKPGLFKQIANNLAAFFRNLGSIFEKKK